MSVHTLAEGHRDGCERCAPYAERTMGGNPAHAHDLLEERLVRAVGAMLALHGGREHRLVTGPQTVETDAEYAERLLSAGLAALRGGGK